MMQNNHVRLGDYIRPYDERNVNEKDLPVLGINIQKQFMPTAANLNEVDLSKYKIVKKNAFVFSGMQTGRDVCIRIALYTEDTEALVSPAYTTFVVDEKQGMLSEYLFIFFSREESDRYGWFISDSSIRANLDWNRFENIQIPLPSIEKQREIVAIWKSLRRLKEENEKIAEPLMAMCRSKIQELKNTMPLMALAEYIEQSDERNTDNLYSEKDVRGLATSKEIILTKANLEGVSLSSYMLFKPQQFAYVPDTSRRGDKVSMAFNDSSKTYLVSSISNVFEVKKPNKLLPSYLFLFFKRTEFDRYARFNSWGSAREAFSWEEMKRVKIPVPPINVQRAIVDFYECAQRAKTIAAEADRQLKTICPALIQYVKHN